MLVLTRKSNQSIMIGDDVEVSVTITAVSTSVSTSSTNRTEPRL
jgi:sRNA-binding carbon storage regulator CsrA